LSVRNPFGAPVYYRETVTSTMDEARLCKDGASGTVIAAGGQTAGRGRSGRPWQTNSGESLSFTVVLHYGTVAAIPPCLTLRAGLAASRAIEDFAAFVQGAQVSPLAGRVLLKWPNDVMLQDLANRSRKAVGILTEAEGGTVYLGMGVNITQKSFPPEIQEKACSIAQIVSQINGTDETFLTMSQQRFTLLELLLLRLYEEFQAAGSLASLGFIEERLYMKGRRVTFISGQPEELSAASCTNPEKTEGILQGVNQKGEICITTDSGETISFITGELKVYT
jgi:BirA family transcriptional regulator, biotin operon repressor / biotin---[acetyl-CoA-carboxylase] ligase